MSGVQNEDKYLAIKYMNKVEKYSIKKLYLSAILDLYDRRIVAFKIGDSNNNELVFSNFDEAIALNPDAHPIFHSDRGYQYTSHEYKRLSEKYHFTKSMSRVGRCLDNQPIERFWGTYKAESFYIKKLNDYESVFNDVSRYIRYYNNYRYVVSG